MENFWRFVPFEICYEDFNGTDVKKQGRNWHILVQGGGKIGTFGQNIYPCCFLHEKCNLAEFLNFSNVRVDWR